MESPMDEGIYLAQAIKQGKALAVSDGSYKASTNNATAAFLLEGLDKEHCRIFGNNRTPGKSKSLSSFRAELGGIASIILVVTSIITYHKVKLGKLKLGLDNKAAIGQIEMSTVLSPQAKSVDLVMDIRRKITKLPIVVEFFWIKGHAAETLGSETYEQYLNCLCNEKEKT